MYRIVTLINHKCDKPIVAYANNEDDAEEVGAALAMAGFDVQVWSDGDLLHEFFS